MIAFSVLAPNIIQLMNCQGIQIGEKNILIVTKEAHDVIQTGNERFRFKITIYLIL